MAETPWLTIVGIGEDGPDGLTAASRRAIASAEVIAGAPRHLALAPESQAERFVWPVPFAEGLPTLLGFRGRRVVMLASGDPFWFGAGTVVTRGLAPGEWRALPAPSTFTLAAARLGWPLEATICLGLHASPLTQVRPHLATGQRLIVLLRDGDAVAELAALLRRFGFGASRLWVLEALGGPRARIRETTADAADLPDIAHPVALGITVAGDGPALPRTAGLSDATFAHDGQITKRPLRALTLSSLAPRPGELLWDIGAGSGSIGIEWLLAHPSMAAIAIEARIDRAARIRENADNLGVDRLQIVLGEAPKALAGLPPPQAVFIGGGLSASLLEAVWTTVAPGARLVCNAVTLEGESLLADWQARVGGALMRIEISEAGPLGRKRGWKASYPVVQWTVAR